MERTFVAVKPDGVQRGLVSEILGRFERKGLKIVGMKMLVPPKDLVKAHYDEHKERPFFNGLVDFLSGGPVVALVLEGTDAIKSARNLIGATKPTESTPGSIRGDLALTVGRNLVHGSDSTESAKREIGLWFNAGELFDWSRGTDSQVYE